MWCKFTCWVRVPIIPELIEVFKGDLNMEVLILINLCWLSVGLYTYLTLEN